MKLDRIDVHILALLQENGRITNQALSERVGLSPRPCLERVRRLLGAGYIRRISAVLEPALFGNPVTIYAHIALASQERQLRERFERHIARIDEVIECFEVSGDTDFLLRFVCPSVDRYYQLSNDLLQNERLGVRRIGSTIVLRTVIDMRGLPPSILSSALD